MPSPDTVRRLMRPNVRAGRGAREDERAFQRLEARLAWARGLERRLITADRRAARAWSRLIGTLPDDHTDDELEALPAPPEQAELDALWAEIEAIRDHDRWPEHLYFSGV